MFQWKASFRFNDQFIENALILLIWNDDQDQPLHQSNEVDQKGFSLQQTNHNIAALAATFYILRTKYKLE